MIWLAYAEGASAPRDRRHARSASRQLKAAVVSRRAESLHCCWVARRKGEMMNPMECEFESVALAAALQSRFPERVTADLRAHVAGCTICSDVVAIANAVDGAREKCARPRDRIPMPAASGASRRFAPPRKRRSRRAARYGGATHRVRLRGRPAGACFGATSTRFQSALGGLRRARPASMRKRFFPSAMGSFRSTRRIDFAMAAAFFLDFYCRLPRNR